MQSHAQWPGGTAPTTDDSSNSPIQMSATSGPVDTPFFWRSSPSPTPPPNEVKSTPSLQETMPASARGRSAGPARLAPSSTTNHTLNNARSTPVLVPSRPQGSVKNIANKFDQAGQVEGGGRYPPHLTLRTSQERYRRPVGGRQPRSPTKDGIRKLQKSPTKEDHRKLQKNRSGQRSPVKSPNPSFGTESTSFGSSSTVMSTRSQPAQVFSPQKPQLPYMSTQPLFGEITSDGRWNGNFDLGNYTSLPGGPHSHRRSSDGSIALGHGRSQSHQDILQPGSTTALSPPPPHKLGHKRSRSDMDALQQPGYPPNLSSYQARQPPPLYPTPPSSGPRNTNRIESPTSRIPVSNRRQSKDSGGSYGPQSRSASALSNPPPGRNRLSKSPTRKAIPNGKENTTPTSVPWSHYRSPPSGSSSGQMLSAKIVAPLPKTSPPLRSSRPRQPVSSATTSASRARAAERYQGQTPRDGRRPSEQWLGKPYDPQKERTRRKIPELGKIDFEARRERIQKAISQNLEETRSLESMRKSSQATQTSQEQEEGAAVDEGALNSADQRQTELFEKDTDSMPGGWPTPGGLTVDTFNIPTLQQREPEPQTANTVDTLDTNQTEFDFDDSPILGRPTTKDRSATQETLTLLTSATYQQPAARPPAPISTTRQVNAQEIQSPSVLENVLRMRQRSSSSPGNDPGYFDRSATGSTEDSPSDIEDKWGLANGLQSVQGSIKIMLDDDPGAVQHDINARRPEPNHILPDQAADEVPQPELLNNRAYVPNNTMHSPASSHSGFEEESVQVTPRKRPGRDSSIARQDQQRFDSRNGTDSMADPAVARVLQHYQSTGSLSQDMLEEMQRHMVDLQRLSANQGSNGFMIQSLLDSILDVQNQQEIEPDAQKQDYLSTPVEVPLVTPDTPPGWHTGEGGGTAVVYRNDTSDEPTPEIGAEDDEDFYVKIRKADEAWEQQQRGDYLRLDIGNDERPLPPPKDYGYTPRSSTGPGSATFPPDLAAGLRISTTGQLEAPGVDGDAGLKPLELYQSPVSTTAPPQPAHAPPPPPPSNDTTGLPFGMAEVQQTSAEYSPRMSNELLPRARKPVFAQSGSSRPSTDSQRMPGPPVMPASVSMSSFAESGRKISLDVSGDGQSRSAKSTSPSPEQKRLLKRRNIIKELVDTEYSYHQDLKIVEDIYKATAVPDLISPEDKKVLFGNCDEIEHFSLHFYDDLRKAVAPVYVPAKSMRWMNKRGSYSTTQSDGTTQGTSMTPDGVDEEKDRATIVGDAFLQSLTRMEHVYSIYLKNHDAANQRLSALRNTPTVKCWLDECHNNASDITSAWDLDSLLVKPTQRVAKYPMLLQQLLENTPESHPDREALSSAAKDSISMLTRINDAKKRADLVDQIVNRKRKDSDVRSGIAKAFGRRTEKLKERVGIAEAFQDPEFDQLAHKFGGHFIRLQICMRDVQDYMNRTEKAMDQVTNYAHAMDLFTDVTLSSGSELESKWRKYGQAVREITSIAFQEHKAAVLKSVIGPMVACIKLHDGPQNAINNRKKRIVDYAKCKSVEKRGEKPDKKMVEAADLYAALNEQLKIELPKLYGLTANLVQGCLICFLEIQLTWYNTWERKLKPVLEAADIPGSIQQIEPAFRADYDLIKHKLDEFGITNGATLAMAANFLSPSTTMEGAETPSSKRPSTLETSKRTMSVDSDSSPMAGPGGYKRRSSSYAPGSAIRDFMQEGRFRSNSSMSNHDSPTPGSAGMLPSQPWPTSSNNTPTSSFHQTRPATANQASTQQPVLLPPRTSAEHSRSPRPASGATYFTARPDLDNNDRFSGIFNSAMPSENTPDLNNRPPSPKPMVNGDMKVMFVCASLFEFSIDQTRREGGYPYLTYVQGEVFDVVAQKGELWLAKNQDDGTNALGWIWEQHFVKLSQD